MEQAQTEMSAIARRLDEESAASSQRGIAVVPLTLQVTPPSTRLALWMLTAAVTFVLLMAIANITGLSLARSAGREREMAIRLALGANRAHIVRQLIVESVTLAAISGIVSLFVAFAGIRLILSLSPAGLARLDQVALDPWSFGWAFALSLLCGVVIGLAPAITTLRDNLKPAFHDGGRGASSGGAARTVRRVLVAGEFALAIILLVGAGLLTRSLLNVQSVDPGFKVERVLSMQLASPIFPSTAQRINYFERVIEQTRTVPGVERAAIASEFFIGGNPEQTITVEGGSGMAERVRFRRDEVTPDFFDTVGTPLLRGRLFSAADSANAPRVAILNELMARRLWGAHDPLGKRFKLGPPDSENPWFTVVGIVGDMRRQGPEHDPIPQMFESLAQNPSRLVTLLVRTSTDPRMVMANVQAAARSVEKDAPVYGVTTLEDRIGSFSAERRFQTLVLIVFSLAALLLAAIGVYGLVRYSVATRAREISIRIAVGAQSRDIVRMILREGLTLAIVGLAVGLVGALWLGQLLSGLVFGVSPTDPTTFVTVSVLLAAVAAAACYFPARGASRIDPLSALKYD
jgi:putative ABC transport system permease protein